MRKAWPSWFVRSGSAVEYLEGEHLDELGSLLSMWQLYEPW
jgi:hypothetical protein